MCPYPWYQVMRISKDKKQQRYQLVVHALRHGVKPAGRTYATSPKTVRKWIKRFKAGGYQALDDLSRRPRHSPLAVTTDVEKHIVKLKAKYKRLGADQVKILENVMEKAHIYQLFFNFERPNTYKENKSPWQLAQEKRPDIPKEALMLPPVDLEALLNKKLANIVKGGYVKFPFLVDCL